MIKRITMVMVSAGLAAMGACTGEPKTPPGNYTLKIPGTEIQIEMVYVPGGEFLMGSSVSEPGHFADEGPVRRVKVKPYWIGKYEVTWEQYEQYAFIKDPLMIDAVTLPSPKLDPAWFKQGIKWFRQRVELAASDSLDSITRPSPYYGDYYHGMGRYKKPAIGMNSLGANYFCKWLSKKTGQTYRLPTEAEWEYACRAGSSSSYTFGDNISQLPEYAWFDANSDFETKEVGLKHPNAFGIHDMHGNVWEFCLEMYDSTYFQKLKENRVNVEPLGPERKGKPVLRGGSWDDPPEALRSAKRLEQLDWWNERDPQRPRGMWWLVDGNVVGFRIARPAE